MTKLTENLRQRINKGQKGLIIYFTAGYPDLATTAAAVETAAAAGADVIEIGIPFSDPMADGPVIQKASAAALRNGTTPVKVLTMIENLRRTTAIPVAVMTYTNTVLRPGAENFVRRCATAGVNGLLVPDLPVEEAGPIGEACEWQNIDLVGFVAPTTTRERIEKISRRAAGFLYCISHTGVTGVKENDFQEVGPIIDMARQYTGLPLAVGFGIGTPRAAVAATAKADAAIVGSAMMKTLAEQGIDGVGELVGKMRAALDEGR